MGDQDKRQYSHPTIGKWIKHEEELRERMRKASAVRRGGG